MKKFKLFLAFFLSLNGIIFSTNLSDLPSPYNELKKVLPFDAHGWYGNGPQLQELITKNNVSVAIEVGSWLGLSTRHIASLLPLNGTVYAVDHWKGSAEHQVGHGAYYKALPYLYEQFLSNVIHAGLTNKIIPIRMYSLDAAKELINIQPDLIYIDAGHETEAVYADLKAWYQYVKHTNGILCGDDWMWGSVRKAVEKFAKENNLIVNPSENFWYFSKT
jgi:predicted O-methyltransferase YrrM